MKALVTLQFQVEVSDREIYEHNDVDQDDDEEMEDFDLVDGLRQYIEADVEAFITTHYTDEAVEKLDVEER
jgi:hypothetical protein